MLKNILLILVLSAAAYVATAQGDRFLISGKVTDEKGEPVVGAMVYVDRSAITSETNGSGHFRLQVPPGEHVVVVQLTGYEKALQKVTVKGSGITLNFTLQPSKASQLQEVAVRGQPRIQRVRESAFNVVALDAKAQFNSTMNLGDLLDKASGVKIRESGGVGSDMGITLNGFTGRHVRVFMDGVPMQGFGSAFQLNNIPVNVAERIEVYKGVVPIEFGTDALGGVINIVTNRTTNSFLDASYSYGSFNTHRTNVSVGKTFSNGISLQLTAFQNYSDNDYKVKTETFQFIEGTSSAVMSADKYWVRRFHDSYRNETVMMKAGIVGKPWADRLLLGLTLGQVHKDVQNQADMRFAFGERTTFSKSVLPSLAYDKRNLMVEGLSVRLTANYNYQRGGSTDTSAYRYNWFGERQLRKAKGEAGNNVLSDYTNSNQSATLNIGYRINRLHSVSANNVISGYVRKPVLAEIPVEEITPADSMRRTSLKNTLGVSYRYTHNQRWNANFFAKHYFNRATGPYTQTVSGRTSTVEREETARKTGYGLATTYFFTDLQLKASVERAYRLPTDQELFGDEIMETGNVALRPENSMNYNLGATLNKEIGKGFTLYTDVSAYYRNTQDFIKRTLQSNVQTQAYTFGNANHGRVTNLGMDAEVRVYYTNQAMLGTTVTYMNLRDKEPWLYAVPGGNTNPSYGTRMPNLPYFFGNADAAYYLHNLGGKGNVLNLNYTLNYVHEFFLKAPNLGYIDSKNIIPQQFYSDFSATYILKNGMYNFSFEARNIENAFLYDNFSLQKPGRSFSVKFRYYLISRDSKK